jgi:PhoPQ-activated pathogenicity-related protein
MRRVVSVILAIGFCTSAAWAAPLDNMDRYLDVKDKSYQWRIIDEKPINPLVNYEEMILTSQTWRGMDWHHRVQIYYPKNMAKVDCAFLLISGGSWNDEKEKEREQKLRKEREARKAGELPAEKPKAKLEFDEAGLSTMILNRIKMPVIVLNNVPLQPIFGGKTEDAIISYTFEKYVETGEWDWPLLLPMTKSAVRCMDAMQEMAKKNWKIDLKGFIVAGGSKRGWTTWLTASMDKRVKACAPAVIDVLNMPAQMKHQLEAWGKYSEMIDDYTMRGIQDKMDTPRGKDLLKIVDPYSYQERATMPKMLIIGTNDRYWPLDALNIYWNDLVGEKYILYVPNKGHAAIDIPRLIANCGALSMLGAGKLSFPKMTWDIQASDKNLSLKVKADKPPKRVWAWLSESPKRDFREVTWRHEDMTESDGSFVYQIPMPESGYAAMYGEGLFDLPLRQQVYLCTNVRIIGPGPKTPKPAGEKAAKAESK